eukprot:276982-Amphidinium_carterae.2
MVKSLVHEIQACFALHLRDSDISELDVARLVDITLVAKYSSSKKALVDAILSLGVEDPRNRGARSAIPAVPRRASSVGLPRRADAERAALNVWSQTKSGE